MLANVRCYSMPVVIIVRLSFFAVIFKAIFIISVLGVAVVCDVIVTRDAIVIIADTAVGLDNIFVFQVRIYHAIFALASVSYILKLIRREKIF